MKTQEKEASVFGRRLQQLRKERGWSQAEVGRRIGTAGKIIGRYELGQITPSVEVARKLAEAFGVTLDSLVSERDIPGLLKDQEMLSRLQNLEDLPAEDKTRILQFLDVMIRDVKTREAYKVSS